MNPPSLVAPIVLVIISIRRGRRQSQSVQIELPKIVLIVLVPKSRRDDLTELQDLVDRGRATRWTRESFDEGKPRG